MCVIVYKDVYVCVYVYIGVCLVCMYVVVWLCVNSWLLCLLFYESLCEYF